MKSPEREVPPRQFFYRHENGSYYWCDGDTGPIQYISEQEVTTLLESAKRSARAEALQEECDYWLDQCEMCLDTDQNPQWCREEFTRLTNKIQVEALPQAQAAKP